MSKQWRTVSRHREFLEAARAAAASYQGEEQQAMLAQLALAEHELDKLDALRRPELLVPAVKEPSNDDLKPFLKPRGLFEPGYF